MGDNHADNIILGSEDLGFIFDGGRLSFDTFSGNLNLGDAATLVPGHSPGFMDIYGDLISTGTLEFELGGTTPGTEHDQIRVHEGKVVLNRIIDISSWGDFAFTPGDEFVLITWDDDYSFDDSGGYDLQSWTGSFFETSVRDYSLVLNYIGSSVPESSGCTIIFLFIFLILFERKIFSKVK